MYVKFPRQTDLIWEYNLFIRPSAVNVIKIICVSPQEVLVSVPYIFNEI
jgi:hypothetical protein